MAAANNNEPYRVANFSAGPSTLPLDVLKDVQKNLIDYEGNGMSVMEMSHRSSMFQKIWDDARADIKTLLNIPDNYEIMFLQGGATLQFGCIPYNFNLNASDAPADFVVTGNWSKKAYEDAKRMFGDKANLVYSTMDTKPQATTVPDFEKECKFSENASYVHICVNETVHGVNMVASEAASKNLEWLLDRCNKKNIPVVADYSSCFMSEPISSIEKYGVIYGGAQKNIGPAGVAVVIVRSDLVGNADPKTPIYMNWNTHKAGKMYNTPPCFSIYVMGLVFKWLKSLGNGNINGNLDAIATINDKKATLLYSTVDESNGFYSCPVDVNYRSKMNIRFNCQSEELDKLFISEATKLGMFNLKGYRTLGGIRASCYNAMTLENVEKLAKFMKEFQDKNSKNQAKLN